MAAEWSYYRQYALARIKLNAAGHKWHVAPIGRTIILFVRLDVHALWFRNHLCLPIAANEV